MPRLSISLPDELMARLEPVKKDINVSQVCREALERRIAIFEQACSEGGTDLDIENLVARLQEERTLIEGTVEKLARRNAADWLATVSYLELKNVVEQSGADIVRYRLPRAAFRVSRQQMRKAAGGFEGAPAIAYKTAWLAYVKAVWAPVDARAAHVDTQAEPNEEPEPAEVAE